MAWDPLSPALVQFLTAVVDGVLAIGYGYVLLAFAHAPSTLRPLTPPDYALGIALAGAAVGHVILGIGVLRRHRRTLVLSVCLSFIYLVVAALLAAARRGVPLDDWLRPPAIGAMVLIDGADPLTLLQLRRT